MNNCGGVEEDMIVLVDVEGVVGVGRRNRPPKTGAATNPCTSLMVAPYDNTSSVCSKLGVGPAAVEFTASCCVDDTKKK